MKKFILPAFIVVAGAGAAFASDYNKKNKTALVPEIGYIYSNVLEMCLPIRQCDTQGSVICTIGDVVGGTQVFGLDDPEEFSDCSVELYKPIVP